MRRLIYKEDNQMYWWDAIIFETDCTYPVGRLSDITWSVRGAGRLSTQFVTFKKVMEESGYVINQIKRLPHNTMPTDENLEIVIGATGNY